MILKILAHIVAKQLRRDASSPRDLLFADTVREVTPDASDQAFLECLRRQPRYHEVFPFGATLEWVGKSLSSLVVSLDYAYRGLGVRLMPGDKSRVAIIKAELDRIEHEFLRKLWILASSFNPATMTKQIGELASALFMSSGTLPLDAIIQPLELSSHARPITHPVVAYRAFHALVEPLVQQLLTSRMPAFCTGVVVDTYVLFFGTRQFRRILINELSQPSAGLAPATGMRDA